MGTTTETTAGSAGRWGPLWDARAADWAEIEDQQAPTYAEALRRVPVEAGQRVLDIGCGAGVFLRMAADRGAHVFGVDASKSLRELARARVPEADLRHGEMESLPYDDGSFDLVNGFNSFFFAADMVGALREAKRIAKPGARVVIQVWGRPERCSLDGMKAALARFLPPRDPPLPLWRPGGLEQIATEARLVPERAFDTTWAYDYVDADAVVRAMLSAPLAVIALQNADEGDVRAAILEALEPYRTPGGGYRLENEWHYLVARA